MKGSDIPCCNVDICLAFTVFTCGNSWSTANLDIQHAAATSKLKWSELSLGILFSSPPFPGKATLSRSGLLYHSGRIHNESSLQVDIKAIITPQPPTCRFMAKGFQQYPPPASVVIYPSPKGFKTEKTCAKLRSNEVVPVRPTLFPSSSCGHRLLQVRCRNVQLMDTGAATGQDILCLRTALLAGCNSCRSSPALTHRVLLLTAFPSLKYTMICSVLWRRLTRQSQSG